MIRKWTITNTRHSKIDTAADFNDAYHIALSWLPPNYNGKIDVDSDNKLITVEVD